MCQKLNLNDSLRLEVDSLLIDVKQHNRNKNTLMSLTSLVSLVMTGQLMSVIIIDSFPCADDDF